MNWGAGKEKKGGPSFYFVEMLTQQLERAGAQTASKVSPNLSSRTGCSKHIATPPDCLL